MKTYFRKFTCVLTLTLSVSFSMFSQSEDNSNDTVNYEALSEELMGTYQIQMIDTRSLPSFPAELLYLIVDKRDENKIVYHQVSETMRIKILPKSMINEENFTPVKRINYITSKDL